MAHGEHVSTRAIVVLQKTQRPVQFEITFQTRASVDAWIRAARRRNDDFYFHSRGAGLYACEYALVFCPGFRFLDFGSNLLLEANLPVSAHARRMSGNAESRFAQTQEGLIPVECEQIRFP